LPSFRELVENIVTSRDYFHLPHRAECSSLDPNHSYYYDLRDRIDYPGKFVDGMPIVKYPTVEVPHCLAASQLGLANLQFYWYSGDVRYLDRAVRLADALVRHGSMEGDCLVWRNPAPAANGQTGWLSGMAQGQAASFLLRVGSATGKDWYAVQARLALNPFFRPIDAGGVTCMLDGYPWFEEVAITEPRFTWNGFVVALFGLRDASLLIGDSRFQTLYDESLHGLEATLHRFDHQGWSRYDLSEVSLWGRLSVANLASPFYHRFHIELLKILERLTDSRAIHDMRQRWEMTLESGTRFYTAIAEKMLFRVLTPVHKGRL